MKKGMINITLSALALLLITGCGSRSGSDSDTDTTSTAYLLDSAVVGASYVTASQSGITGAGGAFKYVKGETVTFKIGSATIGNISSIPADGKVLPSDIAGVKRGATTPAVSNIARFLQSLDDDGNPDNGINITSAVRNQITSNINIQTASAESLTTLVALAGKTLKSSSAAMVHLNKTISNLTSTSSSASSSGGSSSGTSNSGDSSSGSSGTDNTPVSVDYTVSGTITDGRIKDATVFADMDGDGEQNSTEPTFTTDADGGFTLTRASTTGINPIFGKKIIGFGGTDTSTGHAFEGRLKAVSEDGKPARVSPISTFVAALVDKNVTVAKAKEAVAKNLGITNKADMDRDPMETPELFFAAQKLQKTAEIFAATQGGDFNDAFDNVFTALADTMPFKANGENNGTAVPTDLNITTIKEKVVAVVQKTTPSFSIPPAVENSAKKLVKVIKEFNEANKANEENNSTTFNTEVLNNIGSVINAQTETIQGAIESAVVANKLADVDEVTVEVNATKVSEDVVSAVKDNKVYVDPTAKALDKAIRALDAVASVYFGDNNDTSADKKLRYLDHNLSDEIVGFDTNITVPEYDANATAFSNSDLNITWRSNDANLTTTGAITKANYHQFVRLSAEVNATYTTEQNNTAFITKVKNFDLRINRIEHAPVAKDLNVTMNEDTNLSSDVNATDLNTDGTITYSIIDNSELNGTVTFTDKHEGNFTFVPTKDFSGTTWFTYRAEDDTGRSSDANVTFTVINVNDAPVVSELSWPAGKENGNRVLKGTSPFKIDYTVSDIETALADLNITAESNNTSLITVAIGADQNLTVSLVDHAYGDANITLKVDDGDVVVQRSIVIYVSNTEGNLTVEQLDDQNITEDASSYDMNLSIDGDDVTYQITKGSDLAAVSIDANGTLTIKPNSNAAGSDTITIRVTDDKNNTKDMTFNINIANVNDAPVIGDVPDINISVGDDFYFKVDANDSDMEYGDTLTFDINDSNFSVGGSTTGLYLIRETGELNGTAQAEINATTVFITVRDSNGSEANTSNFNITINPYIPAALSLPYSIDAVNAE